MAVFRFQQELQLFLKIFEFSSTTKRKDKHMDLQNGSVTQITENLLHCLSQLSQRLNGYFTCRRSDFLIYNFLP